MKIKNVLSLFDGMSCGQLALQRAGIPYENYFASEIDQPAITIAMKNNPNTVQLGDITKIHFRGGFLVAGTRMIWVGTIDLLIGGSPCQSVSNAGDGSGFAGKSGLFYHFVRIYNEIKAHNPNVKVLLENVKMKKEWHQEITNQMGMVPVLINSALLSAQSRPRYYWTNIHPGVIPLPRDRQIMLKDILEKDVDPIFHVSQKRKEYILSNNGDRLRKKFCQLADEHTEKSICLLSGDDSNWNGNYLRIDVKGNIKKGAAKAGCLTAGANSGGNHSDMDLLYAEDETIRRFTPLEWERLQTVPDNYTEGVSNTQRFRMLGNGWTVEVIAYILSFLKTTTTCSTQ